MVSAALESGHTKRLVHAGIDRINHNDKTHLFKSSSNLENSFSSLQLLEYRQA